MASFHFEILTPAKRVFSSEVSEVVLPAYDGEVGVLPQHGDFVGALGTGTLKIVKEGEDHWFMVSSGMYQVTEGRVTVFTDLAEGAAEVNIESSKAKAAEIDAELRDVARFSQENFPKLKLAYDQESARIEIHRRTRLVN